MFRVAHWIIRPSLIEGILLILLIGLWVDISNPVRAEAQKPPYFSTCLHHRHLVGEAHDLTSPASQPTSLVVVAGKATNQP